MSFLIYAIGFILVIAGVAWALAKAGVATVYIAIACLILLGLGVLSGATKTRHKDPPAQ